MSRAVKFGILQLLDSRVCAWCAGTLSY